jgi:hypothetical protein
MTTAEVPHSEILKNPGRFPPLPDREGNMDDVPVFRLEGFRQWGRVTWLLWVSLLLGIAGRLFYPCRLWPHETASSLADAFIVAAVIGLSLELSAANFLIQKVGDALVGKLAGSTLPSELQGKIGEIVRTSFVRENYVKIYNLSLQNRTMVIDATVSFDVCNYSENTELYVPEMDEEEFFKPEFLRLEYKTSEEQFVETNLIAEPKFEGTRTLQVTGKKEVKLKSIRFDKAAKCTVFWKYRVTMPEEFCDVNEFRKATIKPKFRVESIPDDFEFTFVGGNILPRRPDSALWEFKDAYIGGQQIRAQWIRKSNSEAIQPKAKLQA